MATSEPQRRASAKYRQRNVKCQTISFYPQHMELYEWLRAQSNKTSICVLLSNKTCKITNKMISS